MLSRLIVLFVLVLFPWALYAQVSLKGIVVKINSSFKPIEGTEILIEGGTPTISDQAGNFELNLPFAQPGDLIYSVKIHKKGMEVVNEIEIRQWIASEDILYKVVLCPNGYLEESRRKFYDIGQTTYAKDYERKVAEIKSQLKKNQIEQTHFEMKLRTLGDEYDKQIKLLNYYADKFAHINKDELSTLENQVMELIEQGNIDGAIRIYEESRILEQFDEKLALRDTLKQSIKITKRLLQQQIECYKSDGGEKSLERVKEIESLFDSL